MIKKREDYRYIVEALFDNPELLSEEQKMTFMQENQSQIEEMKAINDEISDLRWSLMSKKEQLDYLEKYSND